MNGSLGQQQGRIAAATLLEFLSDWTKVTRGLCE